MYVLGCTLLFVFFVLVGVISIHAFLRCKASFPSLFLVLRTLKYWFSVFLRDSNQGLCVFEASVIPVALPTCVLD